MDEEKKRRDAELDAFWDVDALIPPRRAPHYVSNTDTAEIELPPVGSHESRPPTPSKEASIPPPSEEPHRRFIPPHTAEEEKRTAAPDLEYEPAHALIRRVRVYRWRSDYRYYEGFVRDAARLYAVRGAECPRATFFSYVPQYSQMTRAQLEWYLYWRTCLREGNFLDTDYSYVLLYVYELINLSDRLEPKAVQEQLCKAWVHYREIYHQLDSYLPEWICDHGLLHRLPPPDLCTGVLLPAVMSHCHLKEYYVSGGGNLGYIRALLAFCSNYDYRKSKFYTGENVALFDSTVAGALKEVTKAVSQEGKLFVSVDTDDSRLARDAYTGALCSYRIKRRLEVEFCSFSRTHELRYFITDVVKHTENRLRAVIGVRSRLSTYALPVAVRTHLDEYLDRILPRRTTASKKQEAAPADYEKLYDLPKRTLSLAEAAAIERASWETTERLVEAFEADRGEEIPSPEMPPAIPEMPIAPPLPAAPAAAAEPTDQKQTFAPYHAFLHAVLLGDASAQRAAAGALGLQTDLVVDAINTLAVDAFGDILLQESDSGFAVIEDYRELAEALL